MKNHSASRDRWPPHPEVVIPPAFHKNLIAALTPGATLLLTDGSILGGGEGTKVEVFESM